MPNGIRCEDCIHSRNTLVDDTRSHGKEYAIGLECELGYKIGYGSPLEPCGYEPREADDEAEEKGE